MLPLKVSAGYSYDARSNFSNKSPQILAKLIQARDWQGVSRRAESHPRDVLIQDCNGLNPLHIALQSFYAIPSTITIRDCQDLASKSVRPASVCSIGPSTTATISMYALTALLASPFSPQGLICQPSPLMINSTMNQSAIVESSSLSEVESTPLHIACQITGIPECVILAVSRANPLALELQDDNGDTPLHLALRYNVSEDILKTLIGLAYHQMHYHSDYDMDDDEEGTAFAKSDYEDGDLPLHVAISHDASIDIIDLLVDSYPQGIFGVNHALQTPLMVACMCGRLDVVEKITLESDAVIGCVRDLLEMGKDESGVMVSRPVYCLWEHFVAKKKESDCIDRNIEALETIANLLTAAASSTANIYLNCRSETAPAYTHDKQVNQHITASETTPNYSFDHSCHLYLIATSLGEEIVPPEFVSFLVEMHPGIVQQVHTPSGYTHLHLAVIKPYCAVGLSWSTGSMQLVGATGVKYENPLFIPDLKI